MDLPFADLAVLIRSLGGSAADLAGVGSVHQPRSVPVKGIIHHTPGSPWTFRQRAMAIGAGTPADDLERLDLFLAAAFDRREYIGGYMVGQRVVVKLEVDDRTTWHSGALSSQHYGRDWRAWARPLAPGAPAFRLHGRDPHVVYDWWDARYGADAHPARVFGWGRLPNRCIGVDLVPDATGGYGVLQLAMAAALTALLARVHGIQLDDRHVTTHSFAAPLERGSVVRGGRVVGMAWDPPPAHFDLDEHIERARAVDSTLT